MQNEPTGLLLAHRVMLKDLDRLAELTARVRTVNLRWEHGSIMCRDRTRSAAP